MDESMNKVSEPAARILVVDDEEDICEILKFNLENAGYAVDTASSSEEALSMLDGRHSLVLLDIMMGGMSGLKMAEVVRKERGMDVPIIFLTARTSENDILTGFSAGGDDYICKPFSVQEVLARVGAVLRRSSKKSSGASSGGETLNFGSISVDLKSKTVYADGSPVTLSKKEFEIFSLLVSSPGQVFSRESMIDLLWKDAPYVIDRTIDVHIARIRSKLGAHKGCIINRSGFGYSFIPSGPEM